MEEGVHLQEIKGLEEAVKSLKEVSEKHDKAMEEFLYSQNKSLEDFSNQVISLLGTKIEESIQRNNTSDYCTTGLPPIEFPKFSGDGFDEWVYKCNKFFDLYKTPDQVKVKLASIHMGGKALHWHKKMEPSTTKWEDYTHQMELKFGAKIHGSLMENEPRETDATPLIATKQPRRRICKLRETSDEEIPKLKESLPRFGPSYCNNESSRSLSLKEEAWQHLLKKSPDRAAVTFEIYLSAMRKIEKEARAAYDDVLVAQLSGPEFRWMMIKDGCLFLQLVFYVLGNPPGRIIFGQKKINEDIKEWIEAMFFVGNQIPLIVLKELMKQIYFRNVIDKVKWEEPKDLWRTALYQLLLLPAQETHPSRPLLQRLSRKVFASRFNWLQQQQPSDLLHGLQLLILGPKCGEEEKEEEEEEKEEEEEEEKDLEGQHELSKLQDAANIDDKISSSATELRKVGIHFRPLRRGYGSRRISFSNSMWCCKAYPILYLPPFLVGDDTELMFQYLRHYEISQKLDKSKQEVSSYLLFMSELIRTPDDAKLFGSKGIIQANYLKHKLKLPGILRRLAPEESYNQNLRHVKLQTSDYSPPLWTKYWQIISFAFVVTVLQTVYTILPYYKSKS